MDLVDQAQDVETMHREAALAAHNRLPRFGSGKSLTHCAEPHCGMPIPEARRRAIPGVAYCVQCQALIERRGRRGGP